MSRSLNKGTLDAGVLVYLFLYALLVIVVTKSEFLVGGQKIFYDQAITTAGVALAISFVAALFGTLMAMAIHCIKFRFFLPRMSGLPLFIPEILVGAALMVVLAKLNLTSDVASNILTQSVYGVCVVAVVLRHRLESIDENIFHAARDLGATPGRAFWRVTFPMIKFSILAGALLAFALSLADFGHALFDGAAGMTILISILLVLVTAKISSYFFRGADD
jgi:ABC-type spermidine/putrescine transport system permease subunit II